MICNQALANFRLSMMLTTVADSYRAIHPFFEQKDNLTFNLGVADTVKSGKFEPGVFISWKSVPQSRFIEGSSAFAITVAIASSIT